ncbi:MAG: von Willebrand factor type A domain-containing protein, partial [Lachnospiraceae bacterium]|nr:von Willebrand factor type A domain-containing protein [Lachnospiraceae bacterium]
EYYISLGYTEKQANRIASLNFEKKFDVVDGISEMFSRKSGGRGAGVMSASKVKTCERYFVAPEELGVPHSPGPINLMALDVENVRTDAYEHFEDNGIKSVGANPTSDFRATNNTAAASIIINNFRNGARISHDMIRTEELLNCLPFNLKSPKNEKFAITTDYIRKDDNATLFIGVKSNPVIPVRQNIALLIDTSGSMCTKTLQIRTTFATVFAKMNEGDILSIITYSDEDHTFVNGMVKTARHDIDYVLDKLKKMYIDGCTNGSAGIETAYKIVEENYMKDGINRVILVTDGDLNFGVTKKDGLTDLISEKKKTGAYLSCIGTGLYNLMDDKLETLAKNGNGNYFVINSLEDADDFLNKKYASLVFPVARNVKVQVEFNPAVVKGYRQIGYENRQISREQFRDDNVISEPFGSDSQCIAGYELYFEDKSNLQPLKYQKSEAVESDELCTITVRYQEVDSDEYFEVSSAVKSEETEGKNAKRMLMCYALAESLRKGQMKLPSGEDAVQLYMTMLKHPEFVE